MVAKGARNRCSSSSTTATGTLTTKKRRVSSTCHDKKKTAKPIGICGFCLGDNEKNASHIPEKMISCAECGNSGHPSCLQYSDKLVKKIRTIRWQCIDCKRCIVCNQSDDSLLFCDFCDSGIHPKCCDPPLNSIPKGDFACHLCRDEITSSPKKSLLKTLSTSSSSARSRRSNQSNDDETDPATDDPHPVDEVSNFILSNKQKMTQNRQQSVQKAMKYLRDKKTIKSSNSKLLKRLQLSTLNTKTTKENDQLIAKSVLASSKIQQTKKKLLNGKACSNPQTSTPLLTRQLSNKIPLSMEPSTSPSRTIRRSDTHPIDDLNKSNSSRSVSKRKHSANSISPISTASSIIIKKRARNESPSKKQNSKNKRKEHQTDDEQSEDDQEIKSSVRKRKVDLDLSKYKNPPAFLNDSLPDNVVENDIYLFLDSRQNSTKLITNCSDKFHHSQESIDDDATNTRWPPYIVFGTKLIKTWYSSSYPQEYARVPRLYICEFCLKYMKCEQVYDRHRNKCTAYHPPANEIYHKDDLSVFEVDGNINRIYCQNLCLLAKLFLDNKTLYYDVEPFLFYVLTKNDSNGCHFLGYFSKEKHCPQKYNLSCITVLPLSQRRGYGRFLIEFSYLLSQKEGQVGTPERPLSTLGAQTYEAYWKIKIVQQLLIYYNENNRKCLLKAIMKETGMATDDIVETLQNLGVLTLKSNGKPVITADVTQLEKMMKNERIKHAHWVAIDSEYLRFTPVLTLLLLTNEENAVEKHVKEIQIVFKEIGRDAAEAASLAAETADGSNGTDVVRYIRRRKFGQKRRSIFVKRRTPINPKSNKNESMITNDDSCATELITNDDGEHSQEYVSRRRVSTINEPIKEEEEEEEAENQMIPMTTLPNMAPSKQTTFKQLKLDQFLKIVQPSANSSIDEKDQSLTEIKIEDPDDSSLQTRRITRNTRLHSTTKIETDPLKVENGISSDIPNKLDFVDQNSFVRQISDGCLSTTSTNDSFATANTPDSPSMSNMDPPLTFKKRTLTSPDIQALIDSTIAPLKNKTEPPVLNREVSTATNASEVSSTLSDILANRIQSSTNDIEDEQRIACIESQLKIDTTAENNPNPDNKEVILLRNSFDTTIKPVESIDDESPPSLTSPTSMIVSQSNHYNYSTRSKQQQQQQQPQSITINNFNTSTNMTYNFNNTSYPYPYPPPLPAPSYDMQSYYYPPAASMDYIPYYPPSSPSLYPSSGLIYGNIPEQQSYYTSNDVNSVPYNTNGTTPYVYPTAQSSSTAPTIQRP